MKLPAEEVEEGPKVVNKEKINVFFLFILIIFYFQKLIGKGGDSKEERDHWKCRATAASPSNILRSNPFPIESRNHGEILHKLIEHFCS